MYLRFQGFFLSVKSIIFSFNYKVRLCLSVCFKKVIRELLLLSLLKRFMVSHRCLWEQFEKSDTIPKSSFQGDWHWGASEEWKGKDSRWKEAQRTERKLYHFHSGTRADSGHWQHTQNPHFMCVLWSQDNFWQSWRASQAHGPLYSQEIGCSRPAQDEKLKS